MAALRIRNLDESVRRRLQLRAARHGRSVEAEARAILTDAVSEASDSAGLFTALLDRSGSLGGVELDVPGRADPALATRNLTDYEGRGIELIDPWPDEGS